MNLNEWMSIIFKILLCVVLVIITLVLQLDRERIDKLEKAHDEICFYHDDQQLNWIEKE